MIQNYKSHSVFMKNKEINEMKSTPFEKEHVHSIP